MMQPQQTSLFSLVSDPWIGEKLGKSAYRVQFEQGGAPQDVLTKSQTFAYAKVPTDRVDRLQTLQSRGFAVIDTNVTFSKLVSDKSQALLGSAEVRSALPSDESQTIAVALKSFVFSRFHLDPQISRLIANDLKAEWVQNYFRGLRGQDMIVAIKQHKVVGFCQLLVQHKDLVIDLIAVDSDFRRQHVGEDLMRFAENKYRGQCDRFVVGTQIANIPSMRLYEKYGFRIEATQYVLHYHSCPAAQDSNQTLAQ